MRANLDNLKNEIRQHLEQQSFAVFHGMSRRMEDMPEVEWDTIRYPDYRQYLSVARKVETELIVFHHREFSAEMIDAAIEDLEAGYLADEAEEIRRRLQEMRVYEGFTCVIELSFEYQGTLYLYLVHPEWYAEFEEIRSQLDFAEGLEEPADEDDETLGGYYSRN